MTEQCTRKKSRAKEREDVVITGDCGHSTCGLKLLLKGMMEKTCLTFFVVQKRYISLEMGKGKGNKRGMGKRTDEIEP